jgi:hypothetical protein
MILTPCEDNFGGRETEGSGRDSRTAGVQASELLSHMLAAKNLSFESTYQDSTIHHHASRCAQSHTEETRSIPCQNSGPRIQSPAPTRTDSPLQARRRKCTIQSQAPERSSRNRHLRHGSMCLWHGLLHVSTRCIVIQIQGCTSRPLAFRTTRRRKCLRYNSRRF